MIRKKEICSQQFNSCFSLPSMLESVLAQVKVFLAPGQHHPGGLSQKWLPVN